MKRFLVLLLCLAAMSLGSGSLLADNASVVFGCNYTISVSIDGQEFLVSHQDRVRNGSAIPFNFQDYQLHLRITEAESETATVELVLSEKTDVGWHQIYASPPSFTVNLGAPADFEYKDDIAIFKVSLIVSKMTSQN